MTATSTLRSDYPTAMRRLEWGIQCGAGWSSLYMPLIELCDKRGVEVLQIKEKFGELRVYVAEAPNEVHEAIRVATEKSHTVCEECGELGSRRMGPWISTLCEKHRGGR